MVLLVDGQRDVEDALAADQAVEDGGALEVEPALEGGLAGLCLTAHLEVEDDVAGAPEHVLQHRLDLAEGHRAVLLQDGRHRCVHADRRQDGRQTQRLPLGAAGRLQRMLCVEHQQHSGQRTLAQCQLSPTAAAAVANIFRRRRVIGKNEPVMGVAVYASQEKSVEVGGHGLDALGLQVLEAVDQLEEQEGELLVQLVGPEGGAPVAEAACEAGQRDDGRPGQGPQHSCTHEFKMKQVLQKTWFFWDHAAGVNDTC